MACSMAFSKNRGTQYRPQNAVFLLMETSRKVPLILGNPHMIERGFQQILALADWITNCGAVCIYVLETGTFDCPRV